MRFCCDREGTQALHRRRDRLDREAVTTAVAYGERCGWLLSGRFDGRTRGLGPSTDKVGKTGAKPEFAVGARGVQGDVECT